jgi:hypothetical protein
MKSIGFTQFKIPFNSGSKVNQIPKIKNSDSKMLSMSDFDNSSQMMDVQSINRQMNQA